MMRAHAPARAAAPSPARASPAVPARPPVSNQRQQGMPRLGPTDDKLEREADAVADQVVQRKCAVCGAEDKDETVRPKAEGPARGSADAAVTGMGGGAPLPAGERRFFEGRLGRDFADVRLIPDHAGAVAIGARAFTLDRQIAFAPGEWRPGTVEGRRLLAHELAHVVQQRQVAARAVRRQAHPPGQRTSCVGDVCFEDTPGAPTPAGHGSATMHGAVGRREYVRGDPSRVVHPAHSVGVDFDLVACTASVPIIVAVQQPRSGTWGSCQGPIPATTAVPNLPQARLNAVQNDIVSKANEALNGWYEVRLEGTACPGVCSGRNIPIRMQIGTGLPQGATQAPLLTVTPLNRPGRSYVQGNDIVLCMGDEDATAAIPHEAVHFALGHGDEYRETDSARAAQASRGQFSPEREIEGDYSQAGSQLEHGRFGMLHERHFQFVPAFLERLYPGCRASLVALQQPVRPDFRAQVTGGYASINGGSGGFLGGGLDLGIPLDRLRRWEAVLGANATFLSGSDSAGTRQAFLFGARLGLEYRTSLGQGGLRLGGFVGAGAGQFTASSIAGAAASDRTAWAPYGEVGLTSGYRFGTGSLRPVLGVEAGATTSLAQPGVIGPVSPEIERDPARFRAFRLGLSLGVEF